MTCEEASSPTPAPISQKGQGELMDLKPEQLDDWKVLTPSARRLDALMEPSFKKAMLEAIADGTKSLVIDLSQVEFMDSSGLGVIVYCRRRMGDKARIVLAGTQPGVATILQLTQLNKVFPLIESPECVLELTL
jgi:anti-sigma B factor antagonist